MPCTYVCDLSRPELTVLFKSCWSSVLSTRVQIDSYITSNTFYILCTTRFWNNNLITPRMLYITLNFGHTFLRHHCSVKENSNTRAKLIRCFTLCTMRFLITHLECPPTPHNDMFWPGRSTGTYLIRWNPSPLARVFIAKCIPTKDVCHFLWVLVSENSREKVSLQIKLHEFVYNYTFYSRVNCVCVP